MQLFRIPGSSESLTGLEVTLIFEQIYFKHALIALPRDAIN